MDQKQECGAANEEYDLQEYSVNYEIGEEYVELDPIELWVGDSQPLAKVAKRRGRPRLAPVVNLARSLQEEVNLVDDPDSECLPSTSKEGVVRVFSALVGDSMMHCEWPLHSQTPMSLNTIVKLFADDVVDISQGQICRSIPQEYTHSGSFIVYYRDLDEETDLADDGLGVWTQVETIQRNYIARGNTFQETCSDNPTLKITCHQFLHQGTDDTGDFIKRIYTGTYRNKPKSPFIVINYEWMGSPHPVAITGSEPRPPPETKHIPEHTEKFLLRTECTADVAASILLSGKRATEVCTRQPTNVVSGKTFAYDLSHCEELEEFVNGDGQEWIKDYERQFPVSTTGQTAEKGAEPLTLIVDVYKGEKNGLVKKMYHLETKKRTLPNGNLLIVSYEKDSKEMDEQEEISSLSRKIEKHTAESRLRIDALLSRSTKLIAETPWQHRSEQVRELQSFLKELKRELT